MTGRNDTVLGTGRVRARRVYTYDITRQTDDALAYLRSWLSRGVKDVETTALERSPKTDGKPVLDDPFWCHSKSGQHRWTLALERVRVKQVQQLLVGTYCANSAYIVDKK